MIVVDASVVVASLLGDNVARTCLTEDYVHVPAHIDVEVADALRKRVRLGHLETTEGWQLLDTFRWMAITRHNVFAMFDRVWELRNNVTAYDAAYVALAEAIDCTLVTGDARLSSAPGLRCAVTVLPG